MTAMSDVRTLHRTPNPNRKNLKSVRASGRSMTINSFIGRATPRQCAPSQFLVIRRSQEMGGPRRSRAGGFIADVAPARRAIIAPREFCQIRCRNSGEFDMGAPFLN